MSEAVKDRYGTVYKSKRAMCSAYNITQSIYWHRLKLGWTEQEALEGKDESVMYNGRVYRSVRDLCAAHGISITTYRNKIKGGATQEDALCKRHTVDHLGNYYKNQKEMCLAYGIDVNTFQYRTYHGWDLKSALTSAVELHCGRNGIVDHLGDEYPSLSAMLKKYNIRMATYQSRRRKGWSLEKNLSTPVRKASWPGTVRDHLGHTYRNVSAMCRAYNVNPITYTSRLKSGWPFAECLMGRTSNKK